MAVHDHRPSASAILTSRWGALAALRGLLCACVIFAAGMTSMAWLASVGTRMHQEWTLTSRNTVLLDLLKNFPDELNTSFAKHSLNVQRSHQVALDRDVPDTRPSACKDLHYKTSNLPKVSIIIPFYNEAWSMLLRALHSVVDRTPAGLLEEILLVDDHSSYYYLKDPLFTYSSKLSPIIRIIRGNRREGLIRARMRAAREAKGEVLVFLDAHVECNENWLPPLLDFLVKHPHAIAVPHIDNIDPQTISYQPWDYVVNGGFTWGMEYVWKLVPDYITSRLKSPSQPYPTPTTIGCAMAMQRAAFFHFGGFDEGMFIWGGENLEISFRTWMCGGAVFIVPCSHIGHLFRMVLPYVFPYRYGGGDVRQKNYQRVAEVWFDDYKQFFYATTQTKLEFSPNETQSLQERKELRQRLNCKNFTWYLDNVIPEMPIPSRKALYFGQLKNMASDSCVSTQHSSLVMTMCGRQAEDQFFSLTIDYHIMAYNTSKCLTAGSDTNSVLLADCNASDLSQLWLFNTSVPEHTQSLIQPSEVSKQAGMACVQPWVPRNTSSLCLVITSRGALQLVVISEMSRDQPQPALFWFFTNKLDFHV